ncbi:hypothetical protein [Paraburkholderia sp. WSM4175]|uniref:hypothetical protein n=1 Tax=Paraburkholderia sp. WSM4175 TaxID=2991072 RepID=UPI003D1E14CB
MPRHVDVSFVVQQESDAGDDRTSTRRFLLQCESAAALLNELKELLENASATQCLEDAGASNVVVFSAPSGRTDRHDAEPLQDPFALGAAYGLLGN